MSNMGDESTPANGGAGSNTPIGETSRPGGAPVRTYMNERIVPYLLEGMKSVAKDQPQNPLRVLGEYLIQKSNEIEGGNTGEKKSPE
ncbi:COMPASS complex subunit Sdc1 [Aspergillus sclerotialis]|uniref:COMPASS complex subunit Sdc1 n=1 Tax=Aspergillus sclerotialis TaxID=2070753 RepID=A0A3A2ZTY6_9EURO|nr:COMPASS complex subunit Sdc1 [Aspergillus sclerotialis]